MSLRSIILFITCIITAKSIHTNSIDLLTLNAHLDALVNPRPLTGCVRPVLGLDAGEHEKKQTIVRIATKDNKEVFIPKSLYANPHVKSKLLITALENDDDEQPEITLNFNSDTIKLLKQAMVLFKNAAEATNDKTQKTLELRFEKAMSALSMQQLTELYALAFYLDVPIPLRHAIAQQLPAVCAQDPKCISHLVHNLKGNILNDYKLDSTDQEAEIKTGLAQKYPNAPLTNIEMKTFEPGGVIKKITWGPHNTLCVLLSDGLHFAQLQKDDSWQFIKDQITLPPGQEITDVSWSPDQSTLALTITQQTSGYPWYLIPSIVQLREGESPWNIITTFPERLPSKVQIDIGTWKLDNSLILKYRKVRKSAIKHIADRKYTLELREQYTWKLLRSIPTPFTTEPFIIWNPLDNTILATASYELYYESNDDWKQYPRIAGPSINKIEYFPHNQAIAIFQEECTIKLLAAKSHNQWKQIGRLQPSPPGYVPKTCRDRFELQSFNERPGSSIISLSLGSPTRNTWIELHQKANDNSWHILTAFEIPGPGVYNYRFLWNHNGSLAAIASNRENPIIFIYDFTGQNLTFNQFLFLSIIKHLAETPEGRKQLQDDKKLFATALQTFPKNMQLDWAYKLLK